MVDLRGSNLFGENSSSSYSSAIFDSCKKLVSLVSNKTNAVNDLSSLPYSIRQYLIKQNLTLNSFTSIPECINILTRLIHNTNESNITIKTKEPKYGISNYSQSLIVFVILIGCVSLISVIGNLCLAKVLYSKRYGLIQTDRIVLCLALSELCLVLIDTPTEIYRFLSFSFTQEWLCRFHTFFEALFSSCIIFYHLLGAFDRFVYIHGQTLSNKSSWSKWCHRISTKSGSIILLILPIICSLPLAICNFLHAIIHISLTNKTCTVQYTHGILISLLISFYLLPLLFSFFLHGKLIYFIRTRHNQHYLSTTAYILPMKRNNLTEFQVKRRLNQENRNLQDRLLVKPKHSSHRHFIMTNTETLGSTTTTMAALQSAPLNLNNSSNSSQSSRSSTGTSSTSVTSPIVLYKINSQANANANRTVLLLVLLLSFYVFCWAPYNVYTWYHAYILTQSSDSPRNNFTSFYSLNQTLTTVLPNNIHADLRRIIYINYSLYLLSMVSMCFSFIFYFSLNRQARQEFSRFIGCICPWMIHMQNKKQTQKYSKQSRQLQYRPRTPIQYPYKNDRIIKSRSPLINDLYKNVNSPQDGTSKRTVLNYGCQIQCCP